MFNPLQRWRERGWQPISADLYAQAWARFGGSVMTHPDVVSRLSALAGVSVRYLGWPHQGELQAAIPLWGNALALSRDAVSYTHLTLPTIYSV